MDNISVPFEKFEKLYKVAKRNKLKMLKFEFIVGSLFPEIMNNIQEEMRRQYTIGYAAGLKEKENE